MQTTDRLGDRVNHISHIDINVTDAERSRRFYESTMPVEAVAHIDASGPFPSLGIYDGAFEGYVLRSASQLGDYPLLRLIEWKQPKPVGVPYASHGNVGFYRLVSMARDIERARAVVIANGREPFTDTTTGVLLMYGPKVEPNPYLTFHAHDPDGITIQWTYDWPREDQNRKKDNIETLAAPKWLAERPVQDRIFALHSCNTDVHRYAAFYTDILGFDLMAGMQTPEPVNNVYSPSGGLTVCDGGAFVPRGDRRFVIDCLRWWETSSHPRPYAEPNHVGIIRCAVEVDDLDRAYESLVAAARQHSELVGPVHPPEVWALGSEVGEQRVVNFTDGEGIMFQLVEAPPYPLGGLHPWGADAVDFDAATVEESTRR